MFTALHPLVRLLYFAGVIILPLFLSDPVVSLLFIIFAVAYQALRKGRRCQKELLFAGVLMLFTALGNFLFNHMGMTVLLPLFSYDLTLESLLYGVSQGLGFAAVLLWFTVLSETADSERVLYLFRFMPKTALVFSMVLGFIPRFQQKAQDIREARLGLNGGRSDGGLKSAFSDFGALLNYVLESSIVTAEAMEARGYRSDAMHFRRYRIKGIDIQMMIVILILTVSTVLCRQHGCEIAYDPSFSITVQAAGILFPSLLAAIPFMVTLWEELRWKYSSVKE